MRTYYGVVKGHTVGVFRRRASFDKAVKDYPGAVWKSFATIEEATKFVKSYKGGQLSSPPKASEDSAPKSSATKGSTPTKGPAPKGAPSVAKIESTATKTVTKKEPSPTATVQVQEPVPLQNTTPVTSKTETPIQVEVSLPPTCHRFKSKRSSPPEPPFKNFLDHIQAPELPPLADPELFNSVFFQDFSDSESKFMPHYGDALLKAMTFDVLSELFGKDNFKAVSNVMALAISNAFYEQIVLHYGLDKLFLCERSSDQNASKGLTHRRGDLLEAYMAATEKDISREGHGYREIREWLLRVLALRLRRFAVQDGSTVCSSGTEQKSLTILPSISAGSNTFASETGPVFTLTSNEAVTPSCCKATTLWNPRNCHNPSQSPIENNQFMTMESPSNTSRSSDLNHFRRFLFESMRHTFAQTYKPNSWNVKSFWSTLSCHLSQLQDMLDDEREMILLFYYRLKDIRSAVEVLCSVLSFPSRLFNSTLHEATVKRLLSLQSEVSVTIIAFDVRCQSGVACFGDDLIVEWDSCKAVRQGQNADANRDGSIGVLDSTDLYGNIYLEPMDIDSY